MPVYLSACQDPRREALGSSSELPKWKMQAAVMRDKLGISDQYNALDALPRNKWQLCGLEKNSRVMSCEFGSLPKTAGNEAHQRQCSEGCAAPDGRCFSEPLQKQLHEQEGCKPHTVQLHRASSCWPAAADHST